jgi:hypothetical protein
VTRHLRICVFVAALTTAFSGAGQAQEKPPVTPVSVQIVLIRLQAGKETSRLPYTVAINANDGQNRASLRMGAQVPVRSTSFTPAKDDKAGQALTSFSYRNIGTNIDCGPVTTVDGRYKVHLSIEDTSIYPDTAGASGISLVPDTPSFRSFQTSTVLALRNGETTQFTAATDRINGEVVRVEVTLTVAK